MSNSNEPILSFQDVTFSYPGQKPLFRRFSFDLYKNDRVAIVGESNRGKTTLMELIAGHLEPDSGEIVRNFKYPVAFQELEIREDRIYHKMDKTPEVWLLDEDFDELEDQEQEIFKDNNSLAWQNSLLYIHTTHKTDNLDQFDKIIRLGPYYIPNKPDNYNKMITLSKCYNIYPLDPK